MFLSSRKGEEKIVYDEIHKIIAICRRLRLLQQMISKLIVKRERIQRSNIEIYESQLRGSGNILK